MRIQRLLPADPTAPRRARESLGALGHELRSRSDHDLRLVLSELVTNAVKYGGLRKRERIEVDLWVGPTRSEVMVRYPQHAGFPPIAPPEPRGEEGWGLFLVDHVADRWSVVECGGYLLIWVELTGEPGPEREPIVSASTYGG